MALLRRAARFLETMIQFGRPAVGHRRHALPLGPGGGHLVRDVLTLDGLDARAHLRALGLLAGSCLALLIGFHAGAVVRGDAIAHRGGRGLEGLDEIGLNVGVCQQLDPGDPAGAVTLAHRGQIAGGAERGHLRDERAGAFLLRLGIGHRWSGLHGRRSLERL